jgi:hypothetical protein
MPGAISRQLHSLSGSGFHVIRNPDTMTSRTQQAATGSRANATNELMCLSRS